MVLPTNSVPPTTATGAPRGPRGMNIRGTLTAAPIPPATAVTGLASAPPMEVSMPAIGASMAAAIPALAPLLRADLANTLLADSSRPLRDFHGGHIPTPTGEVLPHFLQDYVAGGLGSLGRISHRPLVAEVLALQVVPDGVLSRVADYSGYTLLVEPLRHCGCAGPKAAAQSSGLEQAPSSRREVVPAANPYPGGSNCCSCSSP